MKTDRYSYVYRLKIAYPEGSDAPGWKPANWLDPIIMAQMSAIQRFRHKRSEFRWPRERMFLSATSANDRAWLLRACGATVEVQRSNRITWPDPEPWECPSCHCLFERPGFQHEPCGIMVTL